LKGFANNIDFAAFLFLFIISIGCKNYHRNSEHPEITDDDIQKGESLATIYCQGCHSLPDPSLLDSKHWEKDALPYMGPRVGIFNHGFEIYPSSRNDKYLSKDFYPSKPLLSPVEWQYLMDYYIATSPDSLPGQQRKDPIKVGLPLFKVQMPGLKYDQPATCLVQIDTSSRNHSIFLGDAFRKKLLRFNASLELEDSVLVTGPIVGLDFHQDSIIACDIGVLNPNNGKYGKGLVITGSADQKMKVDSIPLFDSLARPVQLTAVDLNQDGLTDFLVCEFGHLSGSLSWLENMGHGKYQHHILRSVPGAIKAYVQDYNHDGLPDLWVLFAQGDEGIFLFTNLGHGKFSEQKV
jgi:hypothetical protein